MADLLGIGITGLFASKKGLETTGHNIANVNTEGYSRQRIHQTTGMPITQSGLVKGTGTRVVSVNRFHDEFIEKQLNKEHNSTEFHKERINHLDQVEIFFNELDTGGLNTLLNNFFNSFRELANQPENETMKMVIRDNARIVVRDFRKIHERLTGIQQNIDKSFQAHVNDTNTLLHNIAKLNREIVRIEKLGGGETGDLRDQRDLAVKELSKLFEIHTYSDNDNNYVVSARGVGTLVAATEVNELAVGPASEDKSSMKTGGSMEIYFKKRPSVAITHKFRGGKIASLTQIRNNDIVELKENMDKAAFELTKIVNTIHSKGYVSRAINIDSGGQPVPFDNRGPTTGINFFNNLDQLKDASLHISLSEEIMSDVTNVVTGLLPNSPGDNRVALAISKIQHEKILNDGNATIEEHYLHTMAKLGMDTAKAKFDLEQAEGLLAQTQAIKERLVGVSLDEEAANMMKYQHAYQAAAKVMQSAEVMFDTILKIKNG